jgi:hypothetical protein
MALVQLKQSLETRTRPATAGGHAHGRIGEHGGGELDGEDEHARLEAELREQSTAQSLASTGQQRG